MGRGVVPPCLVVAAILAASVARPRPAAAQHSPILDATLEEAAAGAPEISTVELRRLLADGGVVLIDARPCAEWAVGHLPGAVCVGPKPGQSPSRYTADVCEVERLLQGQKGRLVVLYCNGPFCGKSRRLADELRAAGFSDVRRYQLGLPTWRALGGVMVIEPVGARYVYAGDRTAVFVDARSAAEFRTGTLAGARHIPLDQVKAAKDDGRLPMEDHGTRIVVFGANGTQARVVAEAMVREAFHNVAYFEDTLAALEIAVR